jgi:hypothetical protein
MWYFIFMSELITEELFDQFRSSDWPRQFSGMARTAKAEGVELDSLESFPTYETGLIIAPKEELQILEDIGIAEDRLFHRNPRFSEFGKQVIMACENLYTLEEHEAASEAARLKLERLIAEARTELDIED